MAVRAVRGGHGVTRCANCGEGVQFGAFCGVCVRAALAGAMLVAVAVLAAWQLS